MLDGLAGLDHLVIAVRDLGAAGGAWAAAGFTVSPRGVQSPQMGSGNHTMMFGEDYLELLGVLSPTPHNARLRGFLAEREGLERCALTAADLVRARDALRAAGVDPPELLHFARPVERPDGSRLEARFSVLPWPEGSAVAGVGVFACQHHTRAAVWLPELQRHANGASGILEALIAAPEPAAAAAAMARRIGSAVREGDGLHRVPTAPGRADLVFATRATLAARHAVEAAALPEEGGAGAVLRSAVRGGAVMLTGTLVAFRAG